MCIYVRLVTEVLAVGFGQHVELWKDPFRTKQHRCYMKEMIESTEIQVSKKKMFVNCGLVQYAQNGNTEVAKLLLEKGAIVDARNKK